MFARWIDAAPGSGIRASVTAAALALLIVGCGSDSEADPRLTVYLSAPLSGPAAADGLDIADGARMALEDAEGSAAGVAVRLRALEGPEGDVEVAGANARRATEDSTAIAYIGEYDSAGTRTSLPITNEAGMLQVSASATAVDLTRQAAGSDQIPLEVQPTGSRTFGRVIPADTVQGEAAGVWMSESGIDTVAVLDGRSPYGQALVDGLESVADAPSVVDARAEALFAVSGPLPSFPSRLGGPALFGSNAQLVGSPPRSRLPGSVRVVSSSLAPTQLRGAGSRFIDRFGARFDREPGRFAAYGYEAMSLILDAISRADDPLDRTSVVGAFFATADRDSVLGDYSIDDVGDTTLPLLGAYESRTGEELRAAREPLTVP